MIRIVPRPEPAHFDEKVRRPGLQWLVEYPARPPRSYWRAVWSDLAEAFEGRCAYTASFTHDGEVDHFVSCDEDRTQAYEWSNYRYCSGWINSKKQNLPSAKLLDPFEVQDDWFELGWPDLQLRVTERCPAELRERAEFMICRLGLRDDERVLRLRRQWVEQFERGRASIELLDELVPLVARMLRARASVPSGAPR